MHTYDAHGLSYFISSSGVMQFQEACYTAVSYAPYIFLHVYTITILATFGVTIFDFFHPGPQPISIDWASKDNCTSWSFAILAYHLFNGFKVQVFFLSK